MAAVTATINTLPVLCTPGDCNKVDKTPAKINYAVTLEELEDNNCCGILGLGQAAALDSDGDEREDELLPIEFKEAMVKELSGAVRNQGRKGLLTYSVTDNQTTEHAALQEAGFLPMAIFRNPNTGNRVTLYGKLINQPRSKPVRKR